MKPNIFSIVRINGNSMHPTLQDGERVIVYAPLMNRRYKQGMIVTLVKGESLYEIRPLANANIWNIESIYTPARLFIKRIIGVEGNTIEISTSELTSNICMGVDQKRIRNKDKCIWHVPKNHIFVRGDGLDSFDSVTWGPIPTALVRQIVLCRYPSLRRIR